jgi:hypothetical protein
MKLAEKIEAFKIKTPNLLEHTFKNGLIFKGSGNYRLHWWLDSIYKDAVNEWNTKKEKNIANFLEKCIA